MLSGPEKVRVGLVLIEVAVRDRKDLPIAGLSLEDFELQVDGKRISRNAIPVFEENCAEAASSRAPGESPPRQAPPSTRSDHRQRPAGPRLPLPAWLFSRKPTGRPARHDPREGEASCRSAAQALLHRSDPVIV